MKLSTQPYKGARDFYPEDKRLQKYLFNTMRSVCERYGYEEYDAPVLEPTDVYLQKGNQEIIEEQTYTFTDRGDRSVTMRTEMTPTVARMVAGKRQELGYPLRWYSIPQCWRYERMQRGRGREFYQLNVDIFGDPSVSAEHELIELTRDLLTTYGASEDMYEIHINSRRFMNEVFYDHLALSPGKDSELNRLIDKKAKMPEDTFYSELEQLLDGEANADKATSTLRALLSDKKRPENLQDLPEDLLNLESFTDIKTLVELCEASGIRNIYFNPAITRGFDYYTGIVFEVFDTHPDNNRSMFGGGRYDNLLEAFGAEPVPTVGFGMGDLTLQHFLELHDLLPNLTTETDVYAICIGDTYRSTTQIVSRLREQNIRVALDSTNRKPSKSIKTADKKQIPYVLFIGEEELESGELTLRHLDSGNETKGDLDLVIQTILSA